MLRTIRKDEIEATAMQMAESFRDYPLYDVFFPGGQHRFQRVFYFFWYRMYTRQRYTYISEDGELLCSVKKPGDRETSPLGLFLNPRFLFGFFRYIPMSSLRLVREYGQMESKYQSRFYNPQTDWNIQAVCVLRQARGNGAFLRALKEMDQGTPIFCETHTSRNQRLYTRLGLETCAEESWHGVTHYVMHRGPVELPKAQKPSHPSSKAFSRKGYESV